MQACDFLCHAFALSVPQSLTLLGLCVILVALTRLIPSDTANQAVPVTSREEEE